MDEPTDDADSDEAPAPPKPVKQMKPKASNPSSVPKASKPSSAPKVSRAKPLVKEICPRGNNKVIIYFLISL